MKRRTKLTIALLLIAVAGTAAVLIAVQRQNAQRLAIQQQQQKQRQAMVRGLAVDDLHRECEAMQAKLKASHDLSSLGMGVQIISYEMNVRSAINGTLDSDNTSELSLELQGPLTPEIKLRVLADAAERLKKADQIYDAAHSMK